MNLPLIPGMSADDIAQMKRQMANPATRNPDFDNYKLAKNVFDFLAYWVNDRGYKPTHIDCRDLGKKPNSVRQSFYNIKAAVVANPQMAQWLAEQYGHELFTKLHTLLTKGQVGFSIQDTFVVVSKSLGSDVGVNPFIFAVRENAAPARTLKTRFEEWLETDMDVPFEAVGEVITDADETVLRGLAAAYSETIAVVITPSSLLARKI